jgi:hypothetical protein
MRKTQPARKRARNKRVIDLILELLQIVLTLHAHKSKREWDPSKYFNDLVEQKLLTLVGIGKVIAQKVGWQKKDLPARLMDPIIAFDLVPSAMPILEQRDYRAIAIWGFQLLAPYMKKDKRAIGMGKSLAKMAYPTRESLFTHVTQITPLGRSGMCEVTLILDSYPALEKIASIWRELPDHASEKVAWSLTTNRGQRAKVK